jgi:hypothetical protein
MDDSSLFRKILYYDPGKPGEEDRIFDHYGNRDGSTIINYLQAHKRRVSYAEIIKPRGYEFQIDFSAVGLDIRYSIPMMSWDYSTLHVIAQREASQRSHRGYLIYDVPAGYWPLPQKANESWRNRDTWIQFWLNKGWIPTDPDDIVRVRAPSVYIKPCHDVWKIYPASAKMKEDDWTEGFTKFLTQIATIAISIAVAGKSFFKDCCWCCQDNVQNHLSRIVKIRRYGNPGYRHQFIKRLLSTIRGRSQKIQ